MVLLQADMVDMLVHVACGLRGSHHLNNVLCGTVSVTLCCVVLSVVVLNDAHAL